jgi:serine/threonine protein kinase/Tfp pilus assembly protein PilF
VPEHDLLYPIAAGAYGEVWLCRNIVGVLRAVKIVRQDSHSSGESFAREFKGLQKFEPVSRSHEGLVDILTLGLLTEPAGFYYVMELADALENPKGQTKGLITNKSSPRAALGVSAAYQPRTLRAELKSRGALSADEVLKLGIKLAAALGHLHAHGLVHRDVKPSNILFIGGEPKLADAGLVAAVDDAQSLVGTAGYIAPEGPGTPQADLYALGKVLYEAAFGKDRQEFPALPVEIAARLDHGRLLELNAILLKACATDRHERYQSADQMHADLELLRAGYSVKRRQTRQRNWRQAKKGALTVGAVAAVLAIAYWRSGWFAPPSGFERPGQSDFSWSTNAEASEEFRNGMRFLQDAGGSREAIRHLQRATELDPNFADAYAYLAHAWNATGTASNSANACLAAEKAVTLNTNCALGHSVLATVRLFELHWTGADKSRKRALTLAPNSEDILLTSALNLAVMGRPEDALAELDKARRVAPGSASHLRMHSWGWVYSWSGEYDRALKIFDQFPSDGHWGDEQHAQAYWGKEDYTNAIRLERKAALEGGRDTNDVNQEFDALEKALMDGGKQAYWKRKLEFETLKTGEDHWMRMAAAHARLGLRDEAFADLRRAKEETPPNFALGINTNPNLDSLREDQRFRGLIAELWRKK